jgi:hypothetical protein
VDLPTASERKGIIEKLLPVTGYQYLEFVVDYEEISQVCSNQYNKFSKLLDSVLDDDWLFWLRFKNNVQRSSNECCQRFPGCQRWYIA